MVEQQEYTTSVKADRLQHDYINLIHITTLPQNKTGDLLLLTTSYSLSIKESYFHKSALDYNISFLRVWSEVLCIF